MNRHGSRTAVIGLLGVLLAACAGPPPTPGQSVATPVDASTSPSLAASSPTASDRSPTSPSPSAAGTLIPTPVPVPAGALIDRMLAAIRSSVGDVTLDLAPDVIAGAAQLDGTADDGAGPGRLLVVASPPGSTIRTNLCLDRDFVQGGSCKRERLPGGDLLYRRGLVEAGDVQTVVVAVQRDDGSGVLVEADNFTIELPPVLVGGEPHPTPQITRDGPIFTLDDLVDIAQAVSEATRDCTLDRCP